VLHITADKLKLLVAAIELSRETPMIRIQTAAKEEGIGSIRPNRVAQS
jgi:hypothetical protein